MVFSHLELTSVPIGPLLECKWLSKTFGSLVQQTKGIDHFQLLPIVTHPGAWLSAAALSMSNLATILFFDSGLGGLTVFREVAAARPDARYVYVADDAAFPYGDLAENTLIARVLEVLGEAIAKHAPDLVVVACNTASMLALAELRARYAVPFVGTVPAIKPACAQSKSKRVAVLGTQGTIHREYTHALIREFAHDCKVTLVGSSRLAGFAEAQLAGEPPADAEIAAEIATCFVDADGRRTDTVVLACTHYPLLLERFHKLAPWPVEWLDPAPAIARRVVDLVGLPQSAIAPAPAKIVFSSGRTVTPTLTQAIGRFGLAPA
jgi:glutamate racemase